LKAADFVFVLFFFAPKKLNLHALKICYLSPKKSRATEKRARAHGLRCSEQLGAVQAMHATTGLKSVPENGREIERLESVPICLEELVLELDPVQSEGMQEAFEHVHGQEHRKRDCGEDGVPVHTHTPLLVWLWGLLPRDAGPFYPTKMNTGFPISMVASMAFSQNTEASSVCANDRAHNRRYEAVLLTMPVGERRNTQWWW
jgi:hypothetical protein